MEQLASQEGCVTEIELDREFPRIGHKVFRVNACRTETGPESSRRTIVCFEDVTPSRG